MKFRNGDRVKVTGTILLVPKGKVGTIKGYSLHMNYYAVEFDEFVDGHDCGGSCRSGYGFWISGCDLELTKNKITLEEFFEMGRACIHCDTEEKANKLLKAFDGMGKKWVTRPTYLSHNNWNNKKSETCYSNGGTFDSKAYCKNEGFTIYEFEDIDLEEPTVSLNKLASEIHENAVEHGWYDDNRTFGDIIALCHSELSEALEEFRNNKPLAYVVRNGKDFTDINQFKSNEKLEGIATELADCIIRILDYCGANSIDIDKILRAKHEYNKTRPYKHGGKTI